MASKYRIVFSIVALGSLSACNGTASITHIESSDDFHKVQNEAQHDLGHPSLPPANPAAPAAPDDHDVPLPPQRSAARGALYSLDQLRIRARDEGFESQIEFQRFVEARLQARNASMNLFPHFGADTALNVGSLNVLNILKSVGDLVPFLLPSRWFHAKGARFASEAEHQGWTLMRADSMHTVEGLCLSIAQDEQADERLRKQWESVRSIRDLIIDKEGSGLLEAGSSDDITSVLNALAQTLIELNEQTDAEYSALAEAVGFTDPDAIASVSGLPQGQPEDQPLPDREGFIAAVVQVSPEISQMGALVQEAKWARKERYFGWLDPSGEGDGDIGLGLGSYLALGRAHQQELIDKESQVRALVAETAATAWDSASSTLESHRLAIQDSQVQQNRLERLIRDLRLGIGFSLSDLVGALQDSTKNEIALAQAQYEFQEEWMKLQRLTMTGPYQGLANLR